MEVVQPAEDLPVSTDDKKFKDQGPTKKPAKAKTKCRIPEPDSSTELANVEAVAANNLEGEPPECKERGYQKEAKEIPRVIF